MAPLISMVGYAVLLPAFPLLIVYRLVGGLVLATAASGFAPVAWLLMPVVFLLWALILPFAAGYMLCFMLSAWLAASAGANIADLSPPSAKLASELSNMIRGGFRPNAEV